MKASSDIDFLTNLTSGKMTQPQLSVWWPGRSIPARLDAGLCFPHFVGRERPAPLARMPASFLNPAGNAGGQAASPNHGAHSVDQAASQRFLANSASAWSSQNPVQREHGSMHTCDHFDLEVLHVTSSPTGETRSCGSAQLQGRLGTVPGWASAPSMTLH